MTIVIYTYELPNKKQLQNTVQNEINRYERRKNIKEAEKDSNGLVALEEGQLWLKQMYKFPNLNLHQVQ
jgi:hypothetical protein